MTQSLSDVNTGSVDKNAFLCPLASSYVCTLYTISVFRSKYWLSSLWMNHPTKLYWPSSTLVSVQINVPISFPNGSYHSLYYTEKYCQKEPKHSQDHRSVKCGLLCLTYLTYRAPLELYETDNNDNPHLVQNHFPHHLITGKAFKRWVACKNLLLPRWCRSFSGVQVQIKVYSLAATYWKTHKSSFKHICWKTKENYRNPSIFCVTGQGVKMASVRWYCMACMVMYVVCCMLDQCMFE